MVVAMIVKLMMFITRRNAFVAFEVDIVKNDELQR